jgi:hypothetical protein
MVRGVPDGRVRDVVGDPGEFGVGGPVVADGQFVAEQVVRDGQDVGGHGMRADLAAVGGAGDGGGERRQDVEDVGATGAGALERRPGRAGRGWASGGKGAGLLVPARRATASMVKSA